MVPLQKMGTEHKAFGLKEDNSCSYLTTTHHSPLPTTQISFLVLLLLCTSVVIYLTCGVFRFFIWFFDWGPNLEGHRVLQRGIDSIPYLLISGWTLKADCPCPLRQAYAPEEELPACERLGVCHPKLDTPPIPGCEDDGPADFGVNLLAIDITEGSTEVTERIE